MDFPCSRPRSPVAEADCARCSFHAKAGECFPLSCIFQPSAIRVAGRSATIFTFVDPTALLCMSHERDSIYSKVYDNAPGFIAIAKGEDHRFEYCQCLVQGFREAR